MLESRQSRPYKVAVRWSGLGDEVDGHGLNVEGCMEKFRIQSIWWKQIQENMRNYPQEKLGCEFCNSTTLPQRCFLRSLLTRIRKLTLSPDFRLLEERPYQYESEGLARLTRITNMVAASSRPYQQPCLHIKWLRTIKKQLKLTFESLDRLFHEIADQMAMRNYHLYLLETQAKNAAMTAVRLSQEGEKDRLREVAVKMEEDEEKRNQPVRGEAEQNQGEAAKMENNKTIEKMIPPRLSVGGVNGGV